MNLENGSGTQKQKKCM